MLDMTEIANGWYRFTSRDNIHPTLLKRVEGDHLLAIAYLKAVDVLPYVSWETTVTSPDDIWENVLLEIGVRSRETLVLMYLEENQIIIPEKTYPGQCHMACRKYHQEYPDTQYYIGFSRSEGWPDAYMLHSFLMQGEKVVEPTGIIRDIYTGINIKHPEYFFAGLDMGNLD